MAEERAQRRLAAILAADVVGYSRLMERDETGTLAALKARRRDVLGPLVSRHQGRIFKFTGDGVLIEFASAVNALQCAVDLQQGMAAVNDDQPEDCRIVLRIGVNLGDVMVEGADLYGDSINIAARLEGLAEPGGICASAKLRDEIGRKLDLVFSDLGERTLKNIEMPVRVYAVRSAKEPAAWRPVLVLPDKPSIAVLPFQNMSGDAEQEYFADGMVEDIITGLSRINWLFVIARNSSFVYKGKAVDVKLVGRELGVRYVLDGSVRKGGNKVRITGQLIEAETGTHLWADRYDGALEDVFELQDRITETVIGVIEPNIRSAEIERARRKPPENLGAYDLFLRAMPHLASMMPKDANKAMELLDQAVTLDPDYAVAHAYLAWVYEMRVARGGFSAADLDAGMRHARAAVTNGTDDPTALAISALVLLHLGRDFPGASAAIARALELNGSCAIAYFLGSHVYAFCGDTTVTRDYAQRGLRLSPFDPLAWVSHQSLGLADLREGRYAEATALLARAMQMNPRFSSIALQLTATLALAGRLHEAKAMAQRALELQPDIRSASMLRFLAFTKPELVEALATGLRAAGVPE